MSQRAMAPSFSSVAVRREYQNGRSDVSSPTLKLADPTIDALYGRLISGLFSGGVFTPAAEHLVDWLVGRTTTSKRETKPVERDAAERNDFTNETLAAQIDQNLVDAADRLAAAQQRLVEPVRRISALLPFLGTLDADAERIIHLAVEMEPEAWASFIGKIESRHDLTAMLAAPVESEPGDSELVAGLLSDDADDPEFVDLDDLEPSADDLAAVEQEMAA